MKIKRDNTKRQDVALDHDALDGGDVIEWGGEYYLVIREPDAMWAVDSVIAIHIEDGSLLLESKRDTCRIVTTATFDPGEGA